MNQKQREFLIDQVNKSYKSETDIWRNKRPEAPSLSNYIVAAVMDGSVKFKSIEHLKKVVKESVLGLNKKNNSLFESEKRSWNDHEEGEIFKIKATELFEVPKGYAEAYSKYQSELEIYEKRQSDLTKVRDTLILKIQIGSDKALESLIEQADNLADLKLMNAQLVSTTKQLTA